MSGDGRAGTFWLFMKTSVFTVLVPGLAVVLIPYLLLETSVLAVDLYGISMLGLIPILLGAGLYLRCAFDFVTAGRGTPAPIDPPVRLVIRGPYRYTRNPMYVAVLTILSGEVLLYRDLALLSFTLLLALVFHVFITVYEERALRRQFGEEYVRYLETVPRWIPGPSGLEELYRRTFLKVGALVLAAGAAAHALRLTVGLPVLETPDSIHAFLVVLPAYAAIGLIVYARRIALPGARNKVIFALATGLLVATVVMHAYSIVAQDNRWYGVFPMWYSALSVIAYGGFALFLRSRTVANG